MYSHSNPKTLFSLLYNPKKIFILYKRGMKIFGCKNIINNLCYGQCQVGQCTIMDSAFHNFSLSITDQKIWTVLLQCNGIMLA